MKKILILLLVIPLVVTAGIFTTYLITKVGLNGVEIPYWYKEKTFEPAPVQKFIDYWKSKA